MANAPIKPAAPVKKESSSGSSIFATLVIPICFIIALCIFLFVLGDPSHYKGGDVEHGEPDYFGTEHRGGIIVPILMTMFLMLIVFTIERFVVIGKASGTGSVDAFVRKINGFLNSGNIDAA